MYYIVWNYTVKNSTKPVFEQEYGRNGTWFHFFARSERYLGSDLLKSTASSEQYLLIDKWISKTDYDMFLKENKSEYDILTKRLSYLYELEANNGSFIAAGI